MKITIILEILKDKKIMGNIFAIYLGESIDEFKENNTMLAHLIKELSINKFILFDGM
jgi:hypothetical protein